MMKYEEIKERVQMGEEFQFYYKEESYWISHNGSEYHLTRVRDSCTQTFNTCIELFENATIDSKNLKYIWNELEF